MKRLLLLICFLAGVRLSIAQAEVIIEGMVKLPPPRSSAAATARYQQKSGVVAAPEPPMAVVYMEGAFPVSASAPASTNSLSQKSFQFMPALLPVRTGTAVTFPNLDDDYHHVFSLSKAKKFDLGRYRQDEKPPALIFDKAGVVRLGCEIHDHMRATILVLDTPYFTKTDPQGNYRLSIPDVPAGKYVLKAWVSDRDLREEPVELKEGAKLQVNFPGK